MTRSSHVDFEYALTAMHDGDRQSIQVLCQVLDLEPHQEERWYTNRQSNVRYRCVKHHTLIP